MAIEAFLGHHFHKHAAVENKSGRSKYKCRACSVVLEQCDNRLLNHLISTTAVKNFDMKELELIEKGILPALVDENDAAISNPGQEGQKWSIQSILDS
jgi:hypothetical protein